MTYDPVLFEALVQVAQNQAQFKAIQPPDLCPRVPPRQDITCTVNLSNPSGNCGKPFDPDRTKDDRSRWCEHEINAWPIFDAIEETARQVKKSGAYEAFCEELFRGLGTISHGGSNIKKISRGCYKITKPKAWKCNAGNWQNLKDVFRISIEFDDLPTLYRGARKLIEKVGVIGPTAKVVPHSGYKFGPIYRIKDRFAMPPIEAIGPDGKPNPDAEVEVLYKDYQVILGLRGPQCSFKDDLPYMMELQLHVKSMLKEKKEGGHSVYKLLRTLSPTERSRIVEWVDVSNAIYGEAFQGNQNDGLNSAIDYIDQSLIDYIAQLQLEPGQLVRNWSTILKGIYDSAKR